VICNDGEEADSSVHKLVSQVLQEVVFVDDAITSELSPHEIEIMKDMKKMFDPKGIMNPGKNFSNNFVHRKDAEDAKKKP
jgi:FAD/FMN-containing dehydrogenase